MSPVEMPAGTAVTEQVRVSSSIATAPVVTIPTTTTTTTTTTSTTETTEDPAWLTGLPVHQITMTMYIPTSCVGALIGRKGSNIALIQKQAQTNGPHGLPVRVSVCSSSSSVSGDKSFGTTGDIHSDMDGNVTGSGTPTGTELPTPSSPLGPVPSTFTPLDYSDPQWTPVVIRADPLAVWNVATQLEQFVLQSSLSLSSSSSPSERSPLPSQLSQDCILDIPLIRQRHACLVGKRGMTLQQVSAHSKCRIHVPPKELKLDMIQLEGSLKQIQTCLEEINDLFIVASHTTNPHNNHYPLLSSFSTSNPSSPGHKSRTTSLSTNNPTAAVVAAAAAQQQQQQQRCQASLVVTQLPSQTKLRSVGRKTDTIIKKRKSNTHHSHHHHNNNNNNATEDNKDSWILTIFGPTSAQVQSAHTILTKWAEGNTSTTTTTSLPEMDHDENNTGGDHDSSASLSRSPARPTSVIHSPSVTHSPSSSSSSPPSMTTTATPPTATTTPRNNKLGGRGRGSGRGRGRGGGRGGGGRGSGGGTPTNGGIGRGREGRVMASSPATATAP